MQTSTLRARVIFVHFCYFAFLFVLEAEAEAPFHLMKDASAEDIEKEG